MSNLKKIEGGVTTPQGFTAGAVYTAIKKRENKTPDDAVLYSDLPCSCAACFTTNKFCAAPVILDREILKKGKARAVVINSGNANAGVENKLGGGLQIRSFSAREPRAHQTFRRVREQRELGATRRNRHFRLVPAANPISTYRPNVAPSSSPSPAKRRTMPYATC